MYTIPSRLHKFTCAIKSIKKMILDGLFPVRCLGCGTFDHWICPQCHTTLPILTEQHCPICKKHITPNGDVCFTCDKKHLSNIDGIFIASYYHDPLLKKAIHYYKYRFAHEISEPLALLIAQSLNNSTLPTPDMIIPVPLHKRRLRWRGFNQSELLAHMLNLQIPVITDILIRIRYTKPQVQSKNKKERQKNLSNAFTTNTDHKITQKNILLIDDVVTTGATLEACAGALKKSGARNVHCLVLARE